ncbi:hypothetical protein [Microbacterium sp. NPDC089695]
MTAPRTGSEHIVELDVPLAAGCVDGVCEMPNVSAQSDDDK